ncbi:MAG: DUF5615 family PIN-like protein [Caldilineaceae bacterium]|nr:DUF5615 family PIN-like protein [Caldilineaceae bacterium]
MNLFATLYLDEDVSALLATLLRVRGIDTTTTREEDMLGRLDSEQMQRAVTLGRAIVTHNRVDFEEIHANCVEQDVEHFGVIVAQRRDVYEIARRLGLLLNRLTADEITNQLFYI